MGVVAPKLHEESTPLGVLVRLSDEEPHAVHPLSRILVAADAAVTEFHLSHQARSNVLEEGIERGDIVVDGAAGDPSRLGKFAHRHLGSVKFAEESKCSLLDPVLRRCHVLIVTVQNKTQRPQPARFEQ